MSASPWFNRVLKKHGCGESGRNEQDGHFHVRGEWGEDAFLILMNIFHLQNDKVPEKVTLQTLAKIAVLVDYYDCAVAVKMHSKFGSRI